MLSKYVTMKRSEIANHQDWMSSWLAIFIVRYKRLDSQIDEETTKWTGSPERFQSVESLANDNNGIIVSAACGGAWVNDTKEEAVCTRETVMPLNSASNALFTTLLTTSSYAHLVSS